MKRDDIRIFRETQGRKSRAKPGHRGSGGHEDSLARGSWEGSWAFILGVCCHEPEELPGC